MPLSRRSFVRSLGAAMLGARALDGGRAWAQAVPPARRLVIFYTPDGVEHDTWRPLREGPGYGYRFSPDSVLQPLQDWRHKMCVLDGLEFTNAREHYAGMTQMLTNVAYGTTRFQSVTGGASLDQYVARNLPGGPRFRSLELGVQCSIWGSIPEARMCFRAAGETVPPNEDPRDVYRRVFEALAPEETRRLVQRRSVLDLVKAEAEEMSGVLSGEEKQKLELHLDALRDLERQIESPRERCAAAPSILDLDPVDNANFPALGRAQMDLMVAALACDLTRVASLQWSMAAQPTVFSWMGHTESHHSLSHVEDVSSEGVAQFLAEERWYSEQFRYLLERLDALPEPAGQGSLLDNSLVLWIKEVGDRITHRCADMPIVIAGGASGRITPGRYLSYAGESHGQLLTSICWAMGLDNRSFGDEAFGTGGLSGFLV